MVEAFFLMQDGTVMVGAVPYRAPVIYVSFEWKEPRPFVYESECVDGALNWPVYREGRV
jgi:hypothetical protein